MSETRLQPLLRRGFSLFIDTNGILVAPLLDLAVHGMPEAEKRRRDGQHESDKDPVYPPGAPLNKASRGWDKSVLSSPCRLGGFRGQERSFVPVFKGDLGGARLGYNPC